MKALPIAELAAEDCVLFMWMVDWCPQDALDLMRAWGFTHKTTAFTWTKTTESGAEFMGQGYWTRANPEVCWLATRGNPKRLFADVRQLVTAPVMEHSRKPEEIYARIERLVAGLYLELFARRPREGWVSWGNELPFVMPCETLPYDPETGEILETSSPATRAVGDVAPESIGDTIAAMRQHVSNMEREFDKRCHAIELTAEKNRNHDLEHFVRRGSFLHVTGKIESAVNRLASDVNSQFDKMAEKIDEIRDRKAA
jgi:N6-adenosine-specific RNA methylase IME4